MSDANQLTSLGAYGGPNAFYGGEFMSDMTFVLQLAGASPDDFTRVFPEMVCREDDQGVRTIIEVLDSDRLPVNLRGATTLTIKLLKPSGEVVEVPATFLTNGFNGKIQYISSDLVPPFDEVGVWFLQVLAIIDSVQQSTEWGAFTVQANIT